MGLKISTQRTYQLLHGHIQKLLEISLRTQHYKSARKMRIV